MATAAIAPRMQTVAIPDPSKVELYDKAYANYLKLVLVSPKG